MVKQFTVPCKFGQETSPVTLYIGHPDNAHHPVHFQSEWLSSTKGGVIPQDLMNTLQKLHDLAKENGADFEKLCYYALISATEHSVNGVTQSEINKYANDFINNNEEIDILEQRLNNSKEKKEETDISSYNEEDEDLLLESVELNDNNNIEDNENNNEKELKQTVIAKEEPSPINEVEYSQEDEDLLLDEDSNDKDI